MIGGQDTYVTGTRACHEDCTIHGTVDFICGGGDNYFYHTDLLIEGDAVIAAAGHEVSTEWGYVFRDCTVKPGTYAETTPDKSYSLGRPWQNEPRCYFLNTVMEILPTDIGWASMAEIPTHFYEYKTLRFPAAVREPVKLWRAVLLPLISTLWLSATVTYWSSAVGLTGRPAPEETSITSR